MFRVSGNVRFGPVLILAGKEGCFPLCLRVAKREDVKEAKKLKRKEDKL